MRIKFVTNWREKSYAKEIFSFEILILDISVILLWCCMWEDIVVVSFMLVGLGLELHIDLPNNEMK